MWDKQKVYIENYFPKWGLQIIFESFLDSMYILCFDFKYWKNSIFSPKCVICLSKSYCNEYSKPSAKHECLDENVFLKADRALSKLNFLFHLNSKTNLVTLRKCVINIICNIIKLVWASVSNYKKQS